MTFEKEIGNSVLFCTFYKGYVVSLNWMSEFCQTIVFKDCSKKQ